MSLDRYGSIHAATPNGRGDGRPTAEQILRDQGLDKACAHDKIYLITGGTAGLGAESARVLHKTGAKIFITGRDLAKGQRIADSIGAANPSNPPIEVIEMDQSRLGSVRDAAKNFLEQSEGKVNMVMVNAGIVASTVPKTADGFEAVFGINYLAPFLLVQLLTPALLASTSPTLNSRLVVVSSAGHRASNIDPLNYNDHSDEYDASKAYAQSKTALILMANEFERRYASRSVHALSLNPGVIIGTEIGRDMPGTSSTRRAMYCKMFPLLKRWEKDIEQGAATQVWASIAFELEGRGGLYLDDVQVARETKAACAEQYCLPGYKSWIWDKEMAARLWKDSLEMAGLVPDGDKA